MTDDPFFIPESWPEARNYLQHEIPARRAELFSRDEAIEAKLIELASDVHSLRTTMMSEVHDIRSGVHQLNESFRSVADQNALLINTLLSDQIEQQTRWKAYDAEQKQQTVILLRQEKVVNREDKWRNAWRTLLLCSLWITLFVLVVEKAAK